MSLAAEPETNPIEEIAEAAVRLVLAASKSKAAAMCALCRVAGDELGRIDGEEKASQLHARRARIHQERFNNNLMRGRR